MHGHLLDDELIERGEELWRGDVVAMAETQSTTGPFTARIHFTLVRHDEETLASA